MERKRILVVDDEKNIRFTVVHSLQSEELVVDAASSGVEGLQRVAQNTYDLLLVDLRMPGMTGIEMLREVRRIRSDLPPAVVITAYGIPQQLLEAANLGAIDYVRKPFSIQTIRATVRDILDRVSLPESFTPSTAMDFLSRGKRDMMAGDRVNARGDLLHAVELDPTLTEAMILLGINTLLDEDSNAAKECFRQVLTVDPSNKTASEYLAWIVKTQA